MFNAPRLVAFTSEHVRNFSITFFFVLKNNCFYVKSHYSIAKAASILGHGLEQVKSVPVDNWYGNQIDYLSLNEYNFFKWKDNTK